MTICTSCNKNVEESTKFKCPKCNAQITRCEKCRALGAEYRCTNSKCDFFGV